MPILTDSASNATFPCPSCAAFIAADSLECRYCAVTIPPYYAHNAALAQDKINRACDEAGWLRVFAGAMWLFFFIRFLPFVGFVGLAGLLVTFFAVPAWLIYWGARFAGIKTRDVDYATARRTWIISIFLWVLMLAVLFFLSVLPVVWFALSSRN